MSSNVAFYRLYRGAGSPDAIDYSAPIATVPADENPMTLPAVAGGWPAGVVWFVAVRSVDAAGAEFAQPRAIGRVEFDPAGNVVAPAPGPVLDLAADPASAQRIDLTWRTRPDATRPAATRFAIRIADPAVPLATLLAGPATASVPATDAGAAGRPYTWRSATLPAGRYRVAIVPLAGPEAAPLAGPGRCVIAEARASRAAAVTLLEVEVR